MDPGPLELYRTAIRPEWVDYNGHMNVAYYVLVFDKGTDLLFRRVDLAGPRACPSPPEARRAIAALLAEQAPLPPPPQLGYSLAPTPSTRAPAAVEGDRAAELGWWGERRLQDAVGP